MPRTRTTLPPVKRAGRNAPGEVRTIAVPADVWADLQDARTELVRGGASVTLAQLTAILLRRGLRQGPPSAAEIV